MPPADSFSASLLAAPATRLLPGAVATQQLAGWGAEVTLQSVLLAFFFSASTGIVFGFWPARKASLLSPIEALRYE